uniref:Uncharacterized protein n=2 Tax=Caenorhabditis japonica TaxID=281687 RepID=A0A8R1EEI3_CAEJA
MKRLFTPNTTPSKIGTWEVGATSPEKKRGPMIPTKASPTKLMQKRTNAFSDRIKTYVFFDLECTDLIKNDDLRSSSLKKTCEKSEEFSNLLNDLCLQTRMDELPRITEMSFMAIPRDTFDELKEERRKIVSWNEHNPDSQQPVVKFIPTSTHTRLLNPTMDEKEWESYEKRRCFDRKGVLVHPKKQCERYNSFEKEWPDVIRFLDSLPKPVVLSKLFY